MSSLKSPFRVSISVNDAPPQMLIVGDHYRICPSRLVHEQARRLTARQIDLVRLGLAIQLADSWVKRSNANNGYRHVSLEVDLLESHFWERPETIDRLKRSVDFLSGGDDWSFRFRKDAGASHFRQRSLLQPHDLEPIVCLYSGGLDSTSGMAIRMSQIQGQHVIPVTVRSQCQRGRVIREQFELLQERGIARPGQLHPYQVGAYLQRKKMRSELGVRLREATHRCRPFLFYSIAGLVADIEGADKVEVYESGIGAVNLPLVCGRPSWHTTRSTHPTFLRLMGDLVTHVNDRDVEFHLPFLHWTKGEMVSALVNLGLSDLARSSVSCIMHPLRRGGSRRQCGYCPACIFRRQALSVAGLEEQPGTYVYDLFGNSVSADQVPHRFREVLLAFLQQVASLTSLDCPGGISARLNNHLLATEVVASGQGAENDEYVALFRRHRREWLDLASSCGARGLWWSNRLMSRAIAA